MVNSADLAQGLRRFRRTAEQIHATYLEPMRQTLLVMHEAQKQADEAVKNPETYSGEWFGKWFSEVPEVNLLRPMYPENTALLGEAITFSAGSLRMWLDELRGIGLSRWEPEPLRMLEELDHETLWHMYQCPRSEYVRGFYSMLGLQVEREVDAITASIGDDKIRGLVPQLVALAQSNTGTVTSSMLANRGMPLDKVKPGQLEEILNDLLGNPELVSREGYSASATTLETDFAAFGYVGTLGAHSGMLLDSYSFLITLNGMPQGFLTAFNQTVSDSPPLYVLPFVQNNITLALKLAEGFARYLGYGAVEVGVALAGSGKKELRAVTAAGLHLLDARKDFVTNTTVMLFIKVITDEL